MRRWTVDYRPCDLWINFQLSAENYLRILYQCHVLQIHCVDWLTGSSLGHIALLLLATTQIYKHGDYEPACQFYAAQYLPELLHDFRQLPVELITHKLWFRTSINKCWSRLVAGVKSWWKETNAQAIISGNTVIIKLVGDTVQYSCDTISRA